MERKMKYELTQNTKNIKNGGGKEDTVLYQIRALKDFGDVKAGQLGGYVESTYNLSQEGNCWIYDPNCAVHGYASVSDNAKVYSGARIFGYASVRDNAYVSGYGVRIFGYATIAEDCRICGEAMIYDDAVVMGFAIISGHAQIYNEAKISGRAKIKDDAKVYKCATVSGFSTVSGKAMIYDNASICGVCDISDEVLVYGSAIVSNATLMGKAVIFNDISLEAPKKSIKKPRRRKIESMTSDGGSKMWKK